MGEDRPHRLPPAVHRALGRRTEQRTQLAWPLTIDFSFAVHSDGTQAQTTTIEQKFERSDTKVSDGRLAEFRIVSNAVAPSDTLNFTAAGALINSTGQRSSQHYFAADSHGTCTSRELTAAAGVLTAVSDGTDCGR